MEDKDKRTEEQPDVEAHKKKKLMASDEARDEAEGDEDFELHGRNKPKAL